jgi:hypothetical protein
MILERLVDEFYHVPESLIYEDIMGLNIWEGWLAQMDDSARQKPSKKHLINDWIRERWDSFIGDFSKEAVETERKLVVHRCIQVDDPKAFVKKLISDSKKPRRKGLGIYWTWDFEAAVCHWGAGRGTDILLTGLVDHHAVDVEETVLANFSPDDGEAEREIRLHEGEPVLLTSVSLSDTDPRWPLDPPLLLRA